MYTSTGLPIDLAANAASLGAVVHRAEDRAALDAALQLARAGDRTAVILCAVDPLQGVPGCESWWDVPVAEVSEQPAVQAARTRVGGPSKARSRFGRPGLEVRR